MSNFKLNKSVAMISGGLGDLGKACALELAKHGVAIALGDLHDESAFAEFKNELDALGVASHYQQINLCDAQANQDWINQVENSLGTANIIIVNAGIVELTGFADITPERWLKQLDVNLNAAFYLSHYASQNMRAKQQPGRIVFMGSWAAHAVHQHIPAYCVSKAGLRSLCQNMALEYAPDDILVNEVAPGTVNAGLSAQVFKENPDIAEEQRIHAPNKKLIQAIDVAREVAHLCDPQIEHHVGSCVLIDGGNTLIGGLHD